MPPYIIMHAVMLTTWTPTKHPEIQSFKQISWWHDNFCYYRLTTFLSVALVIIAKRISFP